MTGGVSYYVEEGIISKQYLTLTIDSVKAFKEWDSKPDCIEAIDIFEFHDPDLSLQSLCN